MSACPKVIFHLDKEMDKSYMHYFLSWYDWWFGVMAKRYPRLKEVGKDIRDHGSALDTFVDEFYKSHEKEMAKTIRRFQAAWDPINDETTSILAKIIECKWNVARIDAYLTLNPIQPRTLKPQRFLLKYNQSPDEMKETTLHEINHIIYFEKWREVFPNDSERRFGPPDIVWALSEILVVVINNDPRLRKYISVPIRGYKEFYRIRTDYEGRKVNAIGYFENLYDDMILKGGVSFSEFLKEAKKRIYAMRGRFSGLMFAQRKLKSKGN